MTDSILRSYQVYSHTSIVPFPAPPLTFPTLTGLIAHYQADLGVTGTSNVSAWADQSGNGYTLTNSGETTGPVYNATGFNGLPTLEFTNSSDTGLRTADTVDFANSATMSVFVVGTLLNATENFGVLVGYQGTGESSFSNNNNSFGVFRSGTDPTLQLSSGLHSIINLTNITYGDPYRFGSILSAGDVGTMYLNGSADGNNSTFSGTQLGGSGNTGTLYVGTATWSGAVSEVVVTSGALSAPDIALLDAYFVAKWGL